MQSSMYAIAVEGFRTTPLGITYYKVRVSDAAALHFTWRVERRFRDFVALRDVLKSQYPAKRIPSLPTRTVFAYFAGDSFLRDRAEALRAFLESILSDIEREPRSVHLREFLNIHRPSIQCDRFPDCVSVRPSGGIVFPEELLSFAFSYLSAKSIVLASRVSATWFQAGVSPSLWKHVAISHGNFERVQKWFIRFLSGAMADIMESFDLSVQFSPGLSQNLRMCLAGDVHFERLKSFKFSQIRPTSQGAPSTMGLCQEILEAMLADSSPLETLEIESELSLEMLKTVSSIVQLRPLRHLTLTFIGPAIDVTDQVFSLLVGMLDAGAESLESFCVNIKYSGSLPSLAPDACFGERIGHYPDQSRFLSILTSGRLKKLKTLSFPFLSQSELLKLDPITFAPTLRAVDIRIVGDGIRHRFGTVDRPNRSIVTDVFSGVPRGIESIRIHTVGVSEQDMLSMTPFILPLQPMSFDRFFDQMLDDWRPRLTGLIELKIDGPYTGFDQLLYYAIYARKWEQFVSLFLRVKRLTLVNCVSAIDEPAVRILLEHLPAIEELEIIGSNENLTDTLLCGLAGLRPVRIRQLKKLTLPMTRHMSFIGSEAIAALRLTGIAVELVSQARVSGRTAFVDRTSAEAFSRH